MPVLTWYRTLLHFQFALLLWGLYPSKHYLSPCNKLHFCLTIVTPEHNASSEGTITPNYLEKISLARTLTRVLLLICFVWERRYDNKEITSQLIHPLTETRTGRYTVLGFYFKFFPANWPLNFMFVTWKLKDEPS